MVDNDRRLERPPIVGEWRQGSRVVRVWSRVGHLVLQAMHAVPTMVLTMKPDGSWVACNDPGRGNAEDRNGRSDEVPSEFKRVGSSSSIHLAEAPKAPRLVALLPPSDKRSGRSDSAHSRRRSRSLDGNDARRQRSRSPNLVPRKDKLVSGRGRGRERRRPDRRHENASRSRSGGASRDRLVALVKDRQRTSAETNSRWRNFCEQNGSGSFDPNRHDSGFLQDWLKQESEFHGYAGDTGVRPSRPRSRSRSCSSGSASARKRSRRRNSNLVRASRDRSGHERGRRKVRGRRGDRKDRGGGRKGRRGHKHRRREHSGRDRDRKRRTSKTERKPKRNRDVDITRSVSKAGSASAASSELVGPRGTKKGDASPSGRAANADAQQLAEKKAKVESLLASAEREHEDAKNSLSGVKEDAATAVKGALQAERDRQQEQMSRKIDVVEREAKLEEERRVKEAREAREAAVEFARQEAEKEAREAIASAERRAQLDMSKLIKAAEVRLSQAASKVKEVASQLSAIIDDEATVRSGKQEANSIASGTVGSKAHASRSDVAPGSTEVGRSSKRASSAGKDDSDRSSASRTGSSGLDDEYSGKDSESDHDDAPLLARKQSALEQ